MVNVDILKIFMKFFQWAAESLALPQISMLNEQTGSVMVLYMSILFLRLIFDD
jgi:hypothetical protein